MLYVNFLQADTLVLKLVTFSFDNRYAHIWDETQKQRPNIQ